MRLGLGGEGQRGGPGTPVFLEQTVPCAEVRNSGGEDQHSLGHFDKPLRSIC